MTDSTIDLEQVRREIDAEVRARRAAGEFPPDFERELDALFARFAPPEAYEDFDASLARAEDSVAIDPVIPVASNNPAFGIVKRVIAKILGWYHVWLAQELTVLSTAITNTLRLLGERVVGLERVTGEVTRAVHVGARVVPVRDDEAYTQPVLDGLDGCRGRVAVLECGSGALLAALVAGGFDAYGVEPRTKASGEALARGLEVRVDESLSHLAAVEADELSGLVLRGVVERVTLGELVHVVELASAALAPGGRLVVTSVTREAWGRGSTVVEADLTPGRPLHPETWAAILSEEGFGDVVATPAGIESYVVTATRSSI